MAVQKQQEVGKKSQTTSQPVASAISPEETELEQYGVWVKEGPEDIIGVDEEIGDEGTEESALTAEEEELLGTLEEASGEEPHPEPKDEGLELENLDEDFSFDLEEEHLELDELPELGEPIEEELRIESPVKAAGGAPASRPTTSHTSREKVDLEPIDDVSAFEADLADSSEEGESMRIPEGSQPILQKIEEDLLSIKEELAALKNEIYSLRGSATPGRPEEKPKEGEVGFFAEDEDETIALTGDELDNILNTADITEETGEPTAIPEDSELMMEEAAPEPDRLIDKDNILEIEDEAPAPARATATEEEVPIELPDEEIVLEDLSELEPEEPEPITEEDITSFDEIQIDLPESEEEAGIEELPEITLDEEELPTDELELDLGEEFDLSTSEKEALDTETIELADEDLVEPTPAQPTAAKTAAQPRAAFGAEVAAGTEEIPDDLKTEIKSILKYMDQLLEALPEDKIEEFARSEYFEVYKKLFDELGLTT